MPTPQDVLVFIQNSYLLDDQFEKMAEMTGDETRRRRSFDRAHALAINALVADPTLPPLPSMTGAIIADIRAIAQWVANAQAMAWGNDRKSQAQSIEQSNRGPGKKRKMTGKHVKNKPLTKPQHDALDMLQKCEGSKTETAKRLGISRAALQERLHGAKLRGELSKPRSVKTMRLPHDKRGQTTV